MRNVARVSVRVVASQAIRCIHFMLSVRTLTALAASTLGFGSTLLWATAAYAWNSSVTTTLHNAGDGSVIANGLELPLGTSVYDMAVITVHPPSSTLGGTLTYKFFHTLDCSDTPTTQAGVALGDPSAATGSLPAGSYGFEATWTGDPHYPGATSACEPFTVAMGSGSVITTLHNAADDSVITNGSSVPLGTSIKDLAAVSGTPPGFELGGTVTYSFFHTIDCSDTPSSQSGVALGDPSAATGPLPAGSYGFEATWTGDSNYRGATSACEPFTVGMGSGSVITTLHNAADHSVIANGSHLASGTSVIDLAAVSGAAPGFELGGTVTYSFFHTIDCSDTPSSQSGVALGEPSAATGPLPAGSYGFEATWTGDSNFRGATSACEPFVIEAVPPVPPATSPAPTAMTVPLAPQEVPSSTTVHTGEPFAGSKPYEAGALAFGGALIGLGLIKRRRVQAGSCA